MSVCILGSCAPQARPLERRAGGLGVVGSQPAPAASSAVDVAPPPTASALPHPPKGSDVPWPPTPPNGATSDFCIDAVEVLDESCCYALPDAPTEELVIYLHGIVPPSKTSRQKTNFESVVSAASRRAGVAALMPRGRKGLAPPGHEGWWGWPTSRGAYRAHAAELAAELADKRRKLEVLTGRPFERVYLMGSSSGAYFAVGLALEGDFIADGYGIISGGADRADAKLETLPRKPYYIGFGSADTVGAGARSLATRLQNAGFPVQLAVHRLPHGTAEVYLDEAFAHFRAPR